MKTKASDDRVRFYYDNKNRCPKCNSRNLVETEINILDIPEGKEYIDRKNITICRECMWRGVIDDLRR